MVPIEDASTGTAQRQQPAPDAVTIYVRRGDTDRERTLAFWIPPTLDRMELLDHGFALDGKQAVFTIAWVSTDEDPHDGSQAGYYDAPFNKFGETLTKALSTAQRDLVAFLRERGFTPEFS